MKRVCKVCRVSIDRKRKGAKFCSSTCRSEYWRNEDENNNIQQRITIDENNNPEYKVSDENSNVQISGLKNVLDDSKNELVNLEKSKNPYYKDLETKIKRLVNNLKSKSNVLLNLQNQRHFQEQQLETLLPVITTTIGMGINLPKKENKTEDPWLRGFSVATGLIGGLLLQKGVKKQRLQNLEKTNIDIQNTNRQIISIKNSISKLKSELKKVPKFLMLKSKTPSLSLPQNDIKDIKKMPKNPKVICSNDLKNMNFKSLNFTDKWYSLFGKPSINFHLVVHGKPGQGKSTFCLQFAHYLASNFGRVLYVSGEEGFSKTMKDKFKLNDAYSENLFLADVRSYEDLKEIVKPNTFHFIFVDSLNNMGIEIEKLKEMRKLYANSGLITISQSTKKGQLRGSLEIEHESDISLKVENGYSFTTKNRFKELGYEYSIFENY